MAKDIFSKIMKNYNNDLEIILEEKDFESNVKNLLLSMMYKIENSYDDYKKVKVNVCNKKKFVEEILDTIKNNCNEVEIVKPISDEGQKLYEANINCIIDKEENKIKTFQNEKSILDAILKIRQQDIELLPKYDLIQKPIKELLTIGNNMNGLEIITDFNGWSWDISRDRKSIIYNKIYNILIILIGNNIIDTWVNNRQVEDEEIPSNVILSSKYNEKFGITKQEIQEQKQDNIEKIVKRFEDLYGEKLTKEFFKKLIQLAILECSKSDKEYKQKIQGEIDKLEEEFLKMSNNKLYLEELSKQKKEITNQIKKIDDILSDDNILKEEYENRNKELANKDKIFSVSHLRLMLEKQRDRSLEEIKNINIKMKPTEFIKIKENLQQKLNFYKEIKIDNTKNENFIALLAKFEVIFLQCFLKKIDISENKKQIENLIYEFRYYNLMLPIIEDIKEQKEEIAKKIIKKACEQKVLITISENEELNYKILKEVLETKIIDIDTIVFTLKYSKGILTLNIYDDNTHDETKQIEITEKTELNVKLNKNIKIWQ